MISISCKMFFCIVALHWVVAGAGAWAFSSSFVCCARLPYGVADEIIDNACRAQSRWWLGWSVGMAEVMAGGVAHGHEL